MRESDLLTYLLTYLSNNNNNNRYNLTTRVSRTVYQDFIDVCRKLELQGYHGYCNEVLEGLMAYVVDKYKDSPKIVQTTIQVFNQPKKVEIVEKQVVVKKQPKRIDYSSWTMEQLEKEYMKSTNHASGLLLELRHRGIDLKQLQKKALK